MAPKPKRTPLPNAPFAGRGRSLGDGVPADISDQPAASIKAPPPSKKKAGIFELSKDTKGKTKITPVGMGRAQSTARKSGIHTLANIEDEKEKPSKNDVEDTRYVPTPEESDEDDIPFDSSGEESVDDLEDKRDQELFEYTEVLLEGEENVMMKVGRRYRRVKVQKGEEYQPTEEEVRKLQADPQFKATTKRLTQQFNIIMANGALNNKIKDQPTVDMSDLALHKNRFEKISKSTDGKIVLIRCANGPLKRTKREDGRHMRNLKSLKYDPLAPEVNYPCSCVLCSNRARNNIYLANHPPGSSRAGKKRDQGHVLGGALVERGGTLSSTTGDTVANQGMVDPAATPAVLVSVGSADVGPPLLSGNVVATPVPTGVIADAKNIPDSSLLPAFDQAAGVTSTDNSQHPNPPSVVGDGVVESTKVTPTGDIADAGNIPDDRLLPAFDQAAGVTSTDNSPNPPSVVGDGAVESTKVTPTGDIADAGNIPDDRLLPAFDQAAGVTSTDNSPNPPSVVGDGVTESTRAPNLQPIKDSQAAPDSDHSSLSDPPSDLNDPFPLPPMKKKSRKRRTAPTTIDNQYTSRLRPRPRTDKV